MMCRRFSVKPARRAAFSLLELLVVVAVLALLLAISLPALRECKTLAKRVVCRSNLHQLFLACDGYLLDNNGLFYQGKNANLNYGGWEGMVAESPRPFNPYVGLPADLNTPDGAEVFMCPADNGGAPGYAFDMKVFLYMGTSYNTNPLLIGLGRIPVPNNERADLNTAINRHIKGLSRTSVDGPSRVLLMGDYCWANQWQPGKFPMKDWHDKAEHFNMVFLDGHTDFVHIRKGIYVNGDYTVLPKQSLYRLALEAQAANQP